MCKSNVTYAGVYISLNDLEVNIYYFEESFMMVLNLLQENIIGARLDIHKKSSCKVNNTLVNRYH